MANITPGAMNGPGLFGLAAGEGYDAGLSNYQRQQELALRQAASQRAQHAQSLQSLIEGVNLASSAPLAAQAVLGPQTDDESPSSAAVRAQAGYSLQMQNSERNLVSGLMTGNIDTSDPYLGHVIAAKPEKYLPMIQSVLAGKDVTKILSDPNSTPQQRAGALAVLQLARPGVKLPEKQIEQAIPGMPAGVAGAESEARAAGEVRGQAAPLPEGYDTAMSGQVRLRSALARGEAQGKNQGEVDAVTLPPGQPSGKYTVAAEGATGTRTGEHVADLLPPPKRFKGSPGTTPSASIVGAVAQEKETPETRTLRGAQTKAADALAKRRMAGTSTQWSQPMLEQIAKFGFAEDPGAPATPPAEGDQEDPGMPARAARTWSQDDIPALATMAKISPDKYQAPSHVVLDGQSYPVFHPRTGGRSEADRTARITAESRQWVGKEAIVGVHNGQPIKRVITPQDMVNYYRNQYTNAPQQ